MSQKKLNELKITIEIFSFVMNRLKNEILTEEFENINNNILSLILYKLYLETEENTKYNCDFCKLKNYCSDCYDLYSLKRYIRKVVF